MSDGSASDSDSNPDGETQVAAAEDPDESTSTNRGLSDRAAFWTSLVLSLVIAVGSVWLIGVRAVHFEALDRVRPTIGADGVGAGWIQGNTDPVLEWAITLIHLADVVMGVFILVMVFIHWIAFRRLAARMRPPDAPRRTDAVATDGGERSPASADHRDERSGDERSQPVRDGSASRRGGDAE